jgi:hypothetical protein
MCERCTKFVSSPGGIMKLYKSEGNNVVQSYDLCQECYEELITFFDSNRNRFRKIQEKIEKEKEDKNGIQDEAG